MDITVTNQGNVNLVDLNGNFDIAASQQFDDQLTSLINDGAKQVILDFSEVAFVASTGLRMILKTAQRLKDESGILRICGVNDTVMEVFKMTGFDTILAIFDIKEKALEGLE